VEETYKEDRDMIDPKIQDELKKAHRLNVMIYIAMIVSMFVYAGVVEYMKRSAVPTGQAIDLSGSDANMFRNILIIIALLEYFIIRFVRHMMLSRKIIAPRISGVKSQFSPPVAQLFAASIMTYALCYTIIVYGFVLFMLSGVTMNFYIFMIIALVFFALFRPQYSQWEDWMEGRGQPANI
jgi:magnesium-transporting ATPase (P-type)